MNKHRDILKMKVNVLNAREKSMKVKDILPGTVFFDSNENLFFKTADMTLDSGKVVSQVWVVVEHSHDPVSSGDPAFLNPEEMVTALVD